MAVLPQTGITTMLVRNTLGEDTNNAGELCCSPKINMLSRCKPVRSPADSIASNPNWWKTGNGMCGIKIPTLSTIRNVTETNWEYERPRGTRDEPFRMGDFRGYNHNAIPDLCSGKKADMEVDVFGTKEFTIGQQTPLEAGSLQAGDFNGSILGDYYFTVLIEDNDLHTVCHSADVQVKNGGKTVTLPTSLFQSGVWQKAPCKCSVALSYVKQNYNNGLQSSSYLSVYRNSIWKNPFYITFKSAMPLEFFLRSVGRNPQSFYSVEEIPGSGFEVNNNLSMKLILRNTSGNVYVLGANAVTVSYRNFKNERVEHLPLTLYTLNSSGNISPITGSLTLPANGSQEIVLNTNFFFRDAGGNVVAPNVNNGTGVSTTFEFYVQHNGMRVLASTTPTYTFKYNNRL